MPDSVEDLLKYINIWYSINIKIYGNIYKNMMFTLFFDQDTTAEGLLLQALQLACSSCAISVRQF